MKQYNTNTHPSLLEETKEALREKLQETLPVQYWEPTITYLREEVYRLGMDKHRGQRR